MATMSDHDNQVNFCDVTADCSTIVSASSDKSLKLWDIETTRCITTLAGRALDHRI